MTFDDGTSRPQKQHIEEATCAWERGRTGVVGQAPSVPKRERRSLGHTCGWWAGAGLLFLVVAAGWGQTTPTSLGG